MMKYPADVNPVMPNCGVTAVAIISGKSVAEVFAHMKAKYSKRGNWKGRTFPNQVMNTIADFKICLTSVYARQGKQRGPQLQKWALEQAKHDEVYLVWTTGHVQVVRARCVYDQQVNGRRVEKYWGRRKFITRIERVDYI